MQNKTKGGLIALLIAAIVGVLLASGAGSAVAGRLITGADVQNDSLTGKDVKNSSLGLKDLNPLTQELILDNEGPAGQNGGPGSNGKDGAKGADGTNGTNGKDGLDGFQGPLPVGAGYADWPTSNPHHDLWLPGVPNETIQKCRAGEYVTGGGYSQGGGYDSNPGYDLGGLADVQITVSAPYTSGEYQPISESDSRFYANQWVVRGVNNGESPVDVRAWVICAPLPATP